MAGADSDWQAEGMKSERHWMTLKFANEQRTLFRMSISHDSTKMMIRNSPTITVQVSAV
ncbi:hypothetical protein [Paracoccus marcusii]|uniref:hypothetical protein n=1 Tax=Paracoccus marcusii TaxID=59779 RepID=UPI0024901ECE|nr:hypothetical protein [Paracoccus marcusii]|tara:strand:- start:126 stop:302 length:177 start_codon:yes stop_codon:yes gene_type:complete